MKRDLTYISRFEYGRSYGWWVRFENRGIKIRKFFADRKHGGRALAYVRAKRFRNQILPQLLPIKHGGASVKRKRPYGYLSRIKRNYVARGHRYVYTAWQAWPCSEMTT